MKNILFYSIIALASVSANAQTSAKDSIAAVKAAAKEAKAKAAADLKAFKAKQASELKAFVEAQKSGKPAGCCSANAVELQTPDDSLAYIFGVAQSRGLKNYMISQLNVDTAYICDFGKGVMNGASVDPTDKQIKAYYAGLNIGGQVIQMAQNVSKDYYALTPEKSLSPKTVAIGLMHGLNENSIMPVNEASDIFQKKMADQQKANMEAKYGENRRAGEKFLEENKKKEGVITTESGLQYKVLVAGDEKSERAKKADKVKVNYEGRLIDGKVFDSSYKRGEPTSFQCNQVIAGWTEALMLMPVGAKWELYIPYQLAYGDRDTGGDIKPYSALIFTVELIENETVTKIAKDKAEQIEAAKAKKAAKK